MTGTLHKHIRESVLKTALLHQLKNGQKAPERTARNLRELLQKFNPASSELFTYDELLIMIKSYSRDDCLNLIIQKLA
ncbi:MAG: hypothetical protein K0R23_773 [Lacrimispora sp.]|jgi:hypothetical protein|nr:hypothetical protein [Lacrimispora sp.]